MVGVIRFNSIKGLSAPGRMRDHHDMGTGIIVTSALPIPLNPFRPEADITGNRNILIDTQQYTHVHTHVCMHMHAHTHNT